MTILASPMLEILDEDFHGDRFKFLVKNSSPFLSGIQTVVARTDWLPFPVIPGPQL